MSDSVRPHSQQPTRLPRPWDSPGKNTGVGCHFLLQSMKVKSESEVAQSCPTLSDPMDCSLPGSSVHGFSRQEYWSGVPLPSPSVLLAFVNSGRELTVTTNFPAPPPPQVLVSVCISWHSFVIFIEVEGLSFTPFALWGCFVWVQSSLGRKVRVREGTDGAAILHPA